MNYEIIFKKSALKELSTIQKHIAQKIFAKIQDLQNNPFPVGYKQLNEFALEGLKYEKIYRIRIADYRVIYVVENEIITIHILKIEHRSKVYRKK